MFIWSWGPKIESTAFSFSVGVSFVRGGSGLSGNSEYGCFYKLGFLYCGCPYKKEPHNLGPMLGTPDVWELPYTTLFPETLEEIISSSWRDPYNGPPIS